MISKKNIQEIIETAQINEVVEEFINLKKRGSNLIGLCPFHNEKTPSFTVSPSKNIYKCFGCGKGGNSIQFVMEHEQMNFPEALRYLAKKYDIKIEEKEFSKEQQEAFQKQESYYIINEHASKFFENALWNSDRGKAIGLSYFKERGYLEHTIKKFQLGFAPEIGDSLFQHLRQNEFNLESAQHIGLISAHNKDFYRSRVMFPIHNLSGKIIAFGGRTLSSNKKVPKYINSPESDIYNKRKILYAIHFAKKSIRNQDECILVEGYTDVISLHQSGLENVVASSGTALTEDQVRLIKRYTRNIKILYDGDPAGIKAALRGLDIVLSQDMNVKLVLLPDGEDPDSFLKGQGVNAFTKFITDEAKDFILFKTSFLLDEIGDDPVRKSIVFKDIIKSIAKIPDAIKRSLYVRECSKLLDIDEKILVNETNKTIRAEIKMRKSGQRPDPGAYREDPVVLEKRSVNGDEYSPSSITDEFQEKDIVRLLITLGEKMYKEENEVTVAEYILANIEEVLDVFDSKLYQKVVKEAVDHIHRGEKITNSFFIHHEDEEIQQLAVNMLSSPYSYASWEDRGYYLMNQHLPEENFVNDSYQSILRFKLRKINKQIKLVQAQIADIGSGEEKAKDLAIAFEVYQQLVKSRNDIASELNTIVLK